LKDDPDMMHDEEAAGNWIEPKKKFGPKSKVHKNFYGRGG